MYEKYLSNRISELRLKKSVSARDMSLSIGQNENYINHIENGKSLPSMQAFFYICEYFNITPKQFFENADEQLSIAQLITDSSSYLNNEQCSNILEIVKALRIVNDVAKRTDI